MYGLNWDNNNNNGVIFNDAYPHGALFEGVDRKPDIGLEYDWFIYSEERNEFIIFTPGMETLAGREMLPEEMEVVRNTAVVWTQLEGTEGAPNIDQMAKLKLAEMKEYFDAENIATSGIIDAYEPVTWINQETEARAYILDDTSSTPTIDAILLGRDLGEAKIDFVNKIIQKANAYTMYYTLLGKLQGISTRIENARIQLDKEAILAITWM